MRLSSSEHDLTLTGSRPPSACGSARPGSGTGRKSGYVKVANTSMADELLFGSPASRRNFEDSTWETPKEKRQLLIWSPSPSASRSQTPTASARQVHKSDPATPSSSANKKPPKIKDTMLKTRHPYKLVKNTPSFVDESLFGPRLKEPSFVAPWNVKPRKPGERPPSRPSHFDYSDYRSCSEPAGADNSVLNGVTKLNLRQTQRPIRPTSANGQQRPAWKP